jgi:hypothetical protein
MLEIISDPRKPPKLIGDRGSMRNLFTAWVVLAIDGRILFTGDLFECINIRRRIESEQD